ncbi:MAG: hypothetical protein ACI9WU_004983, partial [Myxococcota bacterium]
MNIWKSIHAAALPLLLSLLLALWAGCGKKTLEKSAKRAVKKAPAVVPIPPEAFNVDEE